MRYKFFRVNFLNFEKNKIDLWEFLEALVKRKKK